MADDKLGVLKKVFTPRTPIEDRKIFAGRINQLSSLLELINEPGAHGALYGERGVGKTSVANIARIILGVQGTSVVKYSCNSTDSFESLWHKVFLGVSLPYKVYSKTAGFRSDITPQKKEITLAALFNGMEYNADNILKSLEIIPKPFVIILDEFDRLGHEFDKRLFSDIIKNLSDNMPEIIVIIVGVGDTVSSLIGEHASIERNLKQIRLPIMTNDELNAIIENGLKELNMVMSPKVSKQIVEFSCGFPHYTHLLAFNACKSAILSKNNEVNEKHFNFAIRQSITQAQESLRQAYQKATLATKQNIYKEVLWACSVAPTDENGTFQAKDLENPMSKILGYPVILNKFISHLGKFCTDERGNILVALGAPKRRRYKFNNPLMRAFLRLNMHAFGKSQ